MTAEQKNKIEIGKEYYFTDLIYNEAKFNHIPVTIIKELRNGSWRVYNKDFGALWVKNYELSKI